MRAFFWLGMELMEYNREEVNRCLNLFVGEGGIAEIRILNAFGVRGRNDSGYFSNFSQASGALKQYANSPKNPGIYFVLNPFDPSLISRAANRFQERAESTTQDSDITRRRWLFIDCDPKRKSGISSSEEEWEAARDTAFQVMDSLTDRGWPEPTLCSSGNGFHLHYRIDLPSDEASKDLVRNCLRSIAAEFDDELVTIDTKVFNAARICKLYGTFARKGDNTPDRPHRISQIIMAPEKPQIVAGNLLAELAAMAPAEAKPSAAKRSKPSTSAAKRAKKYLEKVPGAISGESGHDWTFHAAALLVIDFDLSIDDALPLLQEWNAKCEPPWSDSELLHKLESVDKLGDERGRALKTKRQQWEEEYQAKFTAASQPSGTPAEKPDPLAYDRKILASIGITYVAQNENSGSIEIFCEATQKFSEIRDISRMKYEHLVLMCGLIARQKIRSGQDDNGDHSLSEVKVAISTLASQESAIEEKVGVGVWESNGCLIVVNSRRLGLLNGKPDLQITANPVQFGTAYDIGDRLDWVDMDRLKREIDSVKATSGQLHVSEVERLVDILGHWTYLPAKNCFPEVIAGMVLSTFVQTLWEWRPQIFLTGQASAGKSTMLKMIAHIFGPLCKTSSNSSAAGLRQYLGASGRILMCDELEKSRHRPDILEMIRASGRGDDSFRGTAGHKHKQFRLQHIFWCASIESGLRSEADQSRFIVAEIRRIADLDMPSVDDLNEIGKKLLSVAICSYRYARALLPILIANRHDDTHPRIAESYAVPVAMYAASVGLSESEAIQLYQRSLAAIVGGETVESDSESLLQDIMTARVRVLKGERSVMDVIENSYLDTASEEILSSVGIRVTREQIFFNHRAVAKHLLSRTDWEGKRIDTVLMRLPGAERIQKRFGRSGGMRFIAIPRSAVSEIDFEDEPSFEDQAKSDSGLWSA